MSRTDPPLRIRLPEALKSKIKTASAEYHRSMNAEIIARLEQSFAAGKRAVQSIAKTDQAAGDLEGRFADLEKVVSEALDNGVQEAPARIAALEDQLRTLRECVREAGIAVPD